MTYGVAMKPCKYVENTILSDAHFLYVCFAPMTSIGVDRVLVKIGISTVPMKRIVTMHCYSPFPVEFAAFAQAGGLREAKRAEARALSHYKHLKTRGEWIAIGVSKEEKKDFSQKINMVLQEVVRRPVTWARVTKKDIVKQMVSQDGRGIDRTPKVKSHMGTLGILTEKRA